MLTCPTTFPQGHGMSSRTRSGRRPASPPVGPGVVGHRSDLAVAPPTVARSMPYSWPPRLPLEIRGGHRPGKRADV